MGQGKRHAAPYGTKSAERLVPGLTMRQIEIWCNKGFMGDHQRRRGMGHYRQFTDDEIERLRNLRVLDLVIKNNTIAEILDGNLLTINTTNPGDTNGK